MIAETLFTFGSELANFISYLIRVYLELLNI